MLAAVRILHHDRKILLYHILSPDEASRPLSIWAYRRGMVTRK